MKFKVTDRATGEVRYMTAEELARIPRRAPTVVGSGGRKWPEIPQDMNRAVAIKLIREALRKRSGKAWSVTGGRGTAYGWLTIASPPARSGEFGYMSESDRKELARLLGLDSVHQQGVSVPSSHEHYREYIQRARGMKPDKIAQAYWD